MAALCTSSLLLLLLVMISCLVCQTRQNEQAASFRQYEKKLLDRILGDPYDNRIRPAGISINASGIEVDGPCIVRVNTYIRTISRIDDKEMEIALQVTFRQEWRDDRLVYDDMAGRIRFLTLTEHDKIWKPDLFFSNEKSGHFHNIIMPNVLVRIKPNGDVLFSIRISLVLFCPMDLKYFPLDLQTCTIKMASYGYTMDDLVFLWKEGGAPVQITDKLSLSRFTLLKFKTDYCTSKTNTGAYSCVRVDMLFKREFSYYLILIYVPCSMLVIVSWVSFWIDPNSAAARVLLGIVALMTMSRQMASISASLPPVSYTKAVDVWTGACLTFVFFSLIEFSVVNYVSRQDVHRADRKRSQGIFSSKKRKRAGKWESESSGARDSGVESDEIEEMISQARDGGFEFYGHAKPSRITMPKAAPNFLRAWLNRFPTRSKRVDVVARVAFPILFAAFNVFYWIKYLWRDDLANLDI